LKETVVLKSQVRTKANSRNSRQLRKAGFVPACVSGRNIKPISLIISEKELRQVLSKHSRTQIYDLDIDGKEKLPAIIKDVQQEPIDKRIMHVEFQHITMTEKIRVDVEILITGMEEIEAKRLSVVRQIDTIPVRGLPRDIPDNIEIDVSNLDVGSTVEIKDIQFPPGIEPDIEPDKVVLSVIAPVIETEDIEEEASEEKTEQQ